MKISEKISVLRNSGGVGLKRAFTIYVPSQTTAWFLAAEGTKPTWLDRQGNFTTLDPLGSKDVAAADYLPLFKDGTNRLVILDVAKAPSQTRWVAKQTGSQWQLLIRLPSAQTGGEYPMDIRVLSPYRNEPELIQEVLKR